jgi:hypothetical protein
MKWVNDHNAAKDEVKRLHAENLELWNENIKLVSLISQLESRSFDNENNSRNLNGG